MYRAPWISDVHLAPARRIDVQRGLIGFVSATIDGTLRLDGIALRKTATGALTLSFPRRRSRRGRDHALVRPTCDRARRAIEAAIFDALGVHVAEEAP